MEDGQSEPGQGTPEPRFITERELSRVLDDCLWQIERRRVLPPPSRPRDGEPKTRAP